MNDFQYCNDKGFIALISNRNVNKCLFILPAHISATVIHFLTTPKMQPHGPSLCDSSHSYCNLISVNKGIKVVGHISNLIESKCKTFLADTQNTCSCSCLGKT